MNIIQDYRKIAEWQEAFDRIPYEFQKDEAMMQIFRKASKVTLDTAKAMFQSRSSVYKGEDSWDGTVHRPLPHAMDGNFSARKNKDGTILRVGVVNKGAGRLGWMADHGSAERINRRGHSSGQMPVTNFFRDAVQTTEPKVRAEIFRLFPTEMDKYIKKHVKP